MEKMGNYYTKMSAKIVLCLAILAFTTGVGYCFASKYRKRKLFFKQFFEFNDSYLQELEYYKRPLKEFIFVGNYKNEFAELLTFYLKYLGKSDPWLIDFLSNVSFLDNEEEGFLKNYFNSLGKADSLSQKNYFLGAKTTLSIWKNAAESDYKKYAELYVKLGVFIGLAIIIIII